MKDMAAAYDSFMELKNNLQEGTKVSSGVIKVKQPTIGNQGHWWGQKGQTTYNRESRSLVGSERSNNLQ